tara:strand:+ start:1414 stop:1821 length:408 start_codon:yes stop_codon:yes gene_type:complete
MSSDVIVVTAPDIYYANNPAILCIGCDEYAETIIDSARRLKNPITIYITNQDATLDWISQAYYQAEMTIINCEYSELFLGFFIDKTNVYYYNNKQLYKQFNLNEVKDPIDPLIKWMTKWQDNKDQQEKNKDYMSK